MASDAPSPDTLWCTNCGTPREPGVGTCPRCGDTPTQLISGGIPSDPGSTAERDALAAELSEALAPGIIVLAPLGEGGMGTVFLGRDPMLKRQVAIKLLHPSLAADPTARQRFLREAEAAATLSHPHVVAIYQQGLLPRSKAPYFVMQFVEGNTLSQEFPPGTNAPVTRVRRTIGEVAGALAAAHAKGLVHRDVKPANIMLEQGTGRAVVLDFGISAVLSDRGARPGDPKLTVEGSYLGTPMYASPEQGAMEPVTAKSDIYSLGCVAFELLCGRPPFKANTPIALLAAHLNQNPPRFGDERGDLDPELAHLLDSCLAKDPAERPSAEALTRYLTPGTHRQVEWPPPGLERLRGAGARLLRTTAGVTLMAWLALATLFLQPSTTLPCCWNTEERGTLFSELVRAVGAILPARLESDDIGAFWAVVAFLLLLGIPIATYVIARMAWRFGTELQRARQAGYPRRVAFDVALDTSRDTTALLSGLEAYATISDYQRRRFLDLRRTQRILEVAATVFAALTPFLWMKGWLQLPASEFTLTPMAALALLAPSLICLCGSILAAAPERAFRRKTRGAVSPRRHAVRPIDRPLATHWLGSVGLKESVGGHPLTRPALAVGTAGLVFWLLGAVGMGLGVTLMEGSQLLEGRRHLPPALRSDLIAWWRSQREMIATVAYPAGTAVDPLAAFFPSAMISSDPDVVEAWHHPPGLGIGFPFDSSSSIWEARSKRIRRAWRIYPRSLPAALRDSLALDTLAPGLRYWRAFAQSRPPTALWYYRPSFVDTTLVLPYLFSPGISGAAWLNEGAALLAADRGDLLGAISRLRLNVTGGAIIETDPEFGIGFGWSIARSAIGKLEAISRHSGDRARGELYHGFAKQPFVQLPYPSYLLFADPGVPDGIAWIGDTALPPSVRWELAGGIVRGRCVNTRELLFGIDPRRFELLDSARVLVKDISGIEPWIEMQERYVRALIVDPEEVERGTRNWNVPWISRLPRWFGFGRAAGRMFSC